MCEMHILLLTVPLRAVCHSNRQQEKGFNNQNVQSG